MRYLFILITMLSVIQNTHAESCKDTACIAVVDAGSSGSRLHLYAYDLEKNQPVNIREIYAKKTQPGLASLELSKSSVDAYLTQLLSDSPAENVPIYFYSTAGMRLLSPQKQQDYYALLNEWFSSQPQWQLRDARTITGKEEGIYGWLAVNYELGTFASPDKPMVGVMDNGGASVQITFPLTHTVAINQVDTVELDIYGRHIALFVHSFLGLGQNELDHQFLDVPDCFANGYPLPNDTLAQGNFLQCEHDISTLINAVHHVDQTVQSIIQSNPVNTWYGIGGISLMAQTTPLDFQSNTFTTKQLANQANTAFCQQDWTTLSTNHTDKEYTHTNCLNSSYIYALLVDGYGISPDQTIHYFPKEQNNDDWTLGVVLHH